MLRKRINSRIRDTKGDPKSSTAHSALVQIRTRIDDFMITEFNKVVIENGKIAVAAFNPHGGEGGAMGSEEINEIIPAIETAKQKGINAIGPYPADTIFINGGKGEFEAILAMYHDQGNIAAKLMDFGAGVTVVAGLPIIRTSVAHGTAFDINAGTCFAQLKV